jgi:ParB family chromosome partitioning protein
MSGDSKYSNVPGAMGHFARMEEALQTGAPLPTFTPAPLVREFDDELEAGPESKPAEESKPAHKSTAKPDSKVALLKKVSNSDNGVVELDPNVIDEWEMVDRPTDEFGDLSELTKSIAQHDQSIPILVRPKKNGRYELIYGRRRWTICKDLDRKVKAFVRDLNDRDAYQQMVIENQHREDLSSWARALSYKKALDTGIYSSQSALAAHLGIDRSVLNNLLVYTKIPDDIVEAVGSFSKVGIHAVRALLTLCEDKENHDHLIGLADRIASGELGAKTLPRAVERLRDSAPKNPTTSVADEHGAKVFSMRRTDRGVLQVTFAKDAVRHLSDEELQQRLLDAIK